MLIHIDWEVGKKLIKKIFYIKLCFYSKLDTLIIILLSRILNKILKLYKKKLYLKIISLKFNKNN